MFEKKHFLMFHPFHWECTNCDQKSTFQGEGFNLKNLLDNVFKDIQDDEDIMKIRIFKHFAESERTIKTLGNECSGIICEVEGVCTECGMSLKIVCWVEISKKLLGENDYKLQIEDIIILDGDLNLQCAPGLYRGVDIAVGLNNLYMRWWYLNGDISIICPFIDSEGFSYFDDVGRKIHKTYNNMFIDKTNRNPFTKIISRDKLWDLDKRRWVSLEERLRKYIGDDCSYKWDDTLKANIIREGDKGSGILNYFTENMLGVNIRSSLPKKDRDNFYYKGYFHCKIYGAILAEYAEVVITSYNYLNVETLQFESVVLQRMDKTELQYQVNKISRDSKLELELIENPLEDFNTLWF
ncbi:MAG: hypothetical protein ACP5EQ_07425 [Candidatus Cloacimonadia bacterium]